MTHGELALEQAIEAGCPVPTNAAQAAELVARENKAASKIIECIQCKRIGRAGRMHYGGHVLPICEACKAEADAQANRLATSVAAAFAPLAQIPAPKPNPKAIKWAQDQLVSAGSADAFTNAKPGPLAEWLDDLRRTLKTGRYPSWMLEAESHECPTCEVDCVISQEADGPSDEADDVPCATCPLCERCWLMRNGEWEAQ
ncbi:MAG: hypothetical protein KF805_12695 [Phycisphaeraceae bacterium]|nr:hypothetical protein [Phycisphaeraceae bacterium]